MFDAKTRLTTAESRRADAEVAVDEAQRLRAEAETVWSRWNARLEALQAAMSTSRARMGAEHLASVEGVVGALIDLGSSLPGRTDGQGRLIDPWERPYLYQLTRPTTALPADALQDWNWDAGLGRAKAWAA